MSRTLSFPVSTAHEYGIVIGTSHHEPLTRAHDEWRRYGEGPWDYARNAPRLRELWRSGVETIELATAATQESWAIAVADGVRRITSHHRIDRPGRHVLKLWMVTPGVVGQRIIIDTGGVRPSYLGPPATSRSTDSAP